MYLENEKTAFLKVCNQLENARGFELLQRECAIAEQLPFSAPAPRLLSAQTHDSWMAAVFEDVRDRNPMATWTKASTLRALTSLTHLFKSLEALNADAPRLDQGQGRFTGFRALQSQPRTLRGNIDEICWVRRNIGRLASIEPAWSTVPMGDKLVHCDLSPGNLIRTRQKVVFVDWAHAHLGSPWIDVMGFLLRAPIKTGACRAGLFAAHPCCGEVDRSSLSTMLVATSGMFLSRALLESATAPANVTKQRLVYGSAGINWLRHLEGWR